MRKQGLSAQL